MGASLNKNFKAKAYQIYLFKKVLVPLEPNFWFIKQRQVSSLRLLRFKKKDPTGCAHGCR